MRHGHNMATPVHTGPEIQPGAGERKEVVACEQWPTPESEHIQANCLPALPDDPNRCGTAMPVLTD